MKDYDCLIKDIIHEWRDSSPQGFLFHTVALERHVIPIIYCQIRKEILREKLVVREKNFRRKFNQLSKSFSHILWIILWTIKWILFFRQNQEKFLVCAVGSDRNLSFAYLENLWKYAHEKHYHLISLNVICNKDYLFRKRIFYYPRFLLQFKLKIFIKEFSKDWNQLLTVLEDLIQKNISIKVRLNSVQRFIRDYSRDYYCVNYFIEKFRVHIVTLVQDFDYTSNRNIYCELFKSKKVSTISLNHSILIYKHIYGSVYSNYSLVWGEYQKKRLEDLSDFRPRKVSAIGHPIDYFRIPHSLNELKYWIYYLPSFENPAMETIYRSFEYSLDYIDSIQKIIQNNNLKFKLITLIHPNDSYRAFKKYGLQKNNTSIKKIINQTGLIFCEDSIVAIEMLKTDIPILFIADKLKDDPFGFTNWKTAQIIYSKDDLEKEIKRANNNPIDKLRRDEHFKYFFGLSENFYEKLKTELNEII